ncbi:MAG: glycosyltransferase [Desulfotalea sp.]|nr:MAG: glycosyltransferase [Desulfotalea sp.]
MKNNENILGYSVTTMGTSDCVKKIITWIDDKAKGKIFVCANPHSLVEARRDPFFQKVLHTSDLVTPDGTGIVLASQIFGGSIHKRVTGSDIFQGLNKALNESGGKSCFFLGSTEQTLATIQQKMTMEFPNITFAGSYSPPYKAEFSEEESQQMIDAVNSQNPDVLWVGMTAPKQEKWLYEHRHKLDVRFMGAIGAVFDFYAGNVKRSHPIFQRMGLEWLPRLLQEPRRLFRRNFISNPIFIGMVLAQRFGFRKQ